MWILHFSLPLLLCRFLHRCCYLSLELTNRL
jgi:hypothetical protein